MPTPDDIATNVDAALAAMEAKDYATARIKLLKADTIIASLPNTTREATSMQWRGTMADLRQELRRLESATKGLQSQQVAISPGPEFEFQSGNV